MERVYHYERHPGYNRVAMPGQEGLQRLEFGLLRVPRDEQYSFSLQGREAALVILNGACTVEVDGNRWDLERVSVFAEPAMAVYLPRHRQYVITASKPADVAVFMAEASEDYLPRLVRREQAQERQEGADHFQRRAYDILGPEFPASRLLVGETYVVPGDWSSYPPHKHDEDRYPEEVRLEEVAFFQVDPPQGFGLQYQYSHEHNLHRVLPVHNDEAVVMGEGYHPLAGAPGYNLYYLWGMAGDGHVIRASLDPHHAWVAAETGAPQPVGVPG